MIPPIGTELVSMIITCPECATEFKADAAVFENGPRKLRCTKCSHVWSHDPAAVAPPPPAADDFSIDAGADGGFGDPGMDDIGALADETPDEAGASAADDGFAGFDEAGSDDGFDAAGTDDFKAEDAISGDAGDEDADGDPFSDTATDESIDADEGDADTAAEPVLHDIESEAAGLMGEDDDALDEPEDYGVSWKSLSAVAAVLLLAAGIYGAYAWRAGIVERLPQTAALYAWLGAPVNLIGLEISEVDVGRSFDNGFPVLSVKGRLTNVSSRPRPIPNLRLALRAPDRQEVYHWTIKVKRMPLRPDESVRFSTRLASPPPEAKDIEIRFQRPSGVKIGAL